MDNLILSPLIPLIIGFASAIVGIGSLFYRRGKFLIPIAREAIHETTLARNPTSKIIDLPVEFENEITCLRDIAHPIVLSEDVDCLTQVQAREGLNRLVKYSVDVNPDFVVGINRGGTLVGAYVCFAMGISHSAFRRCGVVKNDICCDVNFQENELTGNVLVVDDICRTGGTLASAVEMIQRTNPKISNIYSAVVVSSSISTLKSNAPRPSFASFVSANRKLVFPWSKRLSNSHNPFDTESDRLESEYLSVEFKPLMELAGDVYSSIDSDQFQNTVV